MRYTTTKTAGCTSLVCILILGLLVVGCEQETSIVESKPENIKSVPPPSVQQNLGGQREADMGFPADGEVYSAEDLNVPDQVLDRVRNRTPEGFDVPEEMAQGEIENVRAGEDVKPSQAIRDEAVSATRENQTGTAHEDNTAPVVKRDLDLSSPSNPLYLNALSFVWFDYWLDLVDMGSYMEASQLVTYMNLYGFTFVDWRLRAAGGIARYNTPALGLFYTYNARYESGWTWYVQQGDHFLYDQGDYSGGSCASFCECEDEYLRCEFGTQAFDYLYHN